MDECAIDCAEHSAPDGKITGNDRWPRFDGHQTAQLNIKSKKPIEYFYFNIKLCHHSYRSPTESGRSIPESLDGLKDSAADAAHGKGTSAIVHDAIRARFTGVLFHRSNVFVCWNLGQFLIKRLFFEFSSIETRNHGQTNVNHTHTGR